MKREQIEVTLALLGFVCACISSCLIISISLPGGAADVDFLEYRPVDRQLELYTMPSHLRAHRRLLQQDHKERDATASQGLGSSDVGHRRLLTPVFKTEAPSSSPTTISSSSLPAVPQPPPDDQYFTSADTVPLVLAGTASTLIICAMFLYGKDTYDRRRHRRRNGNSSNATGVQERVEEKEEITTAGAGGDSSFNCTTAGNSSSNYSDSRALVPYTREQGDNDYPSMLDGVCSPAIDQMSTMTESIYTHTYASQAWGVGDLAAQANDTASCSKATTLSDDCRVDASTALMSLVKQESSPSRSSTTNSSPCSSLTSNGSNNSGVSHSRCSSRSSCLVGEDCLVDEEFYSPVGSPLEYTPDKKKMLEEDDRDDTTDRRSRRHVADEEDELQRIINAVASSVGDDLSSSSSSASGSPKTMDGSIANNSTTAVVRSIYFAPSKTATKTSTSRISIGLGMSDGDDGTLYPSVISIDPNSPLVGRVFVGDVVTEIDDADTAGLTAEETLALLELMDGRSMVKLTVCSNETDGDSSNCGSKTTATSTTSSDFGMEEMMEEV